MAAGERTDTAQKDELETEVSQPGLGELREAVANHLRRLPSHGSLRRDGIAGLNSAVSSVPDGMASGILAGVNPIYGLYACMVGPIAGGIFSSSISAPGQMPMKEKRDASGNMGTVPDTIGASDVTFKM